MTELLRAPWPGNVRELKNVLHRSLVMSSGEVIERLEGDLQHSRSNLPAIRGQSETIERLINALMRNKGCLEAIAHELGVSVRTVQRRMKESGLRVRDFRGI
jgi:two-component system NtrC family response regulator